MSLGDLVVSLSANTARFESDMGKAAQVLERWSSRAIYNSKQSEKAIKEMSEFGVTSVDRLQRAFDKLNIKSSLQIDKEAQQMQMAFEKIKQSGVASADEIRRASIALKRELNSLNGTNPMASATHGMTGFSLASVTAIAKVQILYSLVNQTMSLIGAIPKTAIDAIENYKSSIITNAALITSIQGKTEDVGAAYKQNKTYAEAVEKVLIRMDTETVASYEQLQLMNRAFVQQGVYLDINSKKSVDAYRNVAQAVAVIAQASPNANMQFQQEVRGLMSGESKPGNQLLNMLEAIDPKIKEHIKLWKEEGTVIEHIGPLLQGFAAASGDIESLWATIKSTMATIRDDVLRGGLASGFAEIIAGSKELNKYLAENKEKIQAFLRDGFADVKTAAEYVWNLTKAIGYFAEPIKYMAIVGGFIAITNAISKMNLALMATPIGRLNALIGVGVAAAAWGTGKYFEGKELDQGASNVRSMAVSGKAGMADLAKQREAMSKFDSGAYSQVKNKFPMMNDENIAYLLKNKGIELETIVDEEYNKISTKVKFNDAQIKWLLASQTESVKVPNLGGKKVTEVNKEAIDALVKLTAAQDEWEQRALRSGKVNDELAAKIASLKAEYKTLIDDTIKATGSQAEQARTYIKEQLNMSIANATLADTKKGQAALDVAEARASLSAYKTGLADQKSALQEQLADRLITQRQYFDSYGALVKAESDKELTILQEALEKANAYALDPSHSEGAALAALAKVKEVEEQIAKVKNDASKKQHDNNRAYAKFEEDYAKRRLDVAKELATLEASNNAFKASRIGTDPLIGAVTNPYENEKAMAADALASKLAGIALLQEAKLEQFNQDKLTQTELWAFIKATDEEGRNASITATQRAAKAKTDAEKGMYDQMATFASKTFPKIASFQNALKIASTTYDKDTLDKTKLSTQGKMQMMSDYGNLGASIFADLANAEDQTSRAGFENAKAYNLGAAVMSTAAGIMAQLAGPDGAMPSAWARAAIVGVMGAIQIAKIASMSFGGGGNVSNISQGAFSGGSAGQSAVGNSIGSPINAMRDSQSQDDLRRIASGMENASLAIVKVADGLTEIADLFREGGLMALAAGAAPGIGGATGDPKKTGLIKGLLQLDPMHNMTFATNPLDLFKGIGSTLFGFGNSWQTTGGGVSVGMKGDVVSLQNFINEVKKGGWFTSDKNRTLYSQGDPGFNAVLQSALDRIAATINRSAIATGTTAALNNAYLAPTNINTAGRKAEDIQKDLEKWFESASNELAKTVVGLQDFTFYGENAFDALVRLSTALQSTNESIELIGAKFVQSTLWGANAAFKLQDMMGGAEKFADKVETYFTSMFSETEQTAARAAQATRQVNVAFAEMNIKVPTSNEAFRSIVNSLDITTESGAQLFAAMMDVAESFALVKDTASDYWKMVQDSENDLSTRLMKAQGIDTSVREMLFAQQAEMADYQEKKMEYFQIEKLKLVHQLELANEVKKASDEATKAVEQANKTVLKANYDRVQAEVSLALKAANALSSIITGPMTVKSPETLYKEQQVAFAAALAQGNKDGIVNIGQTLLGASRNYNASGAGYVADYNMVTKALADIAGINGTATVDKVQQQIDVLNNISKNTAATYTGIDTLASILGRQMNADNAAAVMRQVAGLDAQNLAYDLDKNGVVNSRDAMGYLRLSRGLPAFAKGGLHSGGLRLVGEFGPELEVTGASRIYSADQTRGILSNGSADSREKEELRESNRHLGAIVRVLQSGLTELIEQGYESNVNGKVLTTKLNLAQAA